MRPLPSLRGRSRPDARSRHPGLSLLRDVAARAAGRAPGAVNAKGLDFYDRLVDAMLARGIKAWPCLYHWDLPQALQDRGGWGNRDVVGWFTDYAEVMAKRLGDRVENWVTFNEPNVVAWVGHEEGRHAPGIRSAGAARDPSPQSRARTGGVGTAGTDTEGGRRLRVAAAQARPLRSLPNGMRIWSICSKTSGMAPFSIRFITGAILPRCRKDGRTYSAGRPGSDQRAGRFPWA